MAESHTYSAAEPWNYGVSATRGLESGAESRFLAGDEGSALSAWVGAAIAMVGMLVAACAIGTAAFLYQRRQNKQASVIREVQKVQVKSADNGGKKPKGAWPDPEVGGDQPDTTVMDKASMGTDVLVTKDGLSASVRMELAETLRGIMEDEISRGLKASGISDRLDRLEMQAKEQQVLSGSLLPTSSKVPEPKAMSDLDSTMSSTAKSQAPCVPASDLAATLKANEAKAPMREASPDSALRDVATNTEADNAEGATRPGRSVERNDLTLSPSARQKRYPDPPEKAWMHIDQDRSLRMSLTTTQRNLQKRDIQTQELHRQLRVCEQDCQAQKLEACYSVKRLQDLLCDPSYAPQAQAGELQAMRRKVDDLSGRLADSRQSELQWSMVAKRQRAFFMQSERVSQEGVNVFRKHPAGELFLAPPPVYLDDDVDEDPRKPPWDVGNSHINPYVCDSWFLEPNACAQRCAVPNLSRWDEDCEDGIADGSDSEEGSQGSAGDTERQQLMLRLPAMPPESPDSPSPDDEDFEPPEPTDQPMPLPELGPLSSRSL